MSGADERSGACSGKEVILSGRFKTVRARTAFNTTKLTKPNLTHFVLSHVLNCKTFVMSFVYEITF